MPLQATSGAASYDAFGGGVPVVPNYIEDVFRTHLYNGDTGGFIFASSGVSIVSGGMMWVKSRGSATNNYIFSPSLTSANHYLNTNTTAAQSNSGVSSNNFEAVDNGGGMRFGGAYSGISSSATGPFTSWTFRKQPKFFDVVTYTGNGNSTSRNIAHNLGSVAGTIIVKRTDSTSNWAVAAYDGTNWKVGTTTTPFALNLTNASTFNVGSVATSTTFNVCRMQWSSGGSPTDDFNNFGDTYVAYLFAHNAGGFGLTGTDNVISCGSGSWSGGSDNVVNLGYEVQWLMYKSTDIAGSNWMMFDTMRGMSYSASEFLRANLADAAGTYNSPYAIYPTATGFTVPAGMVSTGTYIYIAIRRGPMKVPTSGTGVYSVFADGASTNPKTFSAGFPTDFAISQVRSTGAGSYNYAGSRLTGNSQYLVPQTTGSEQADATPIWTFDLQNSFKQNISAASMVSWLFRRAPSFFDEVCYTGNGGINNVQNHSLADSIGMLIIKRRDSTGNWSVFVKESGGNYSYWNSSGTGTGQGLNGAGAATGTNYSGYNSYLTNTTFNAAQIDGSNNINANGGTFVAYLFASCAGVQYINSYVGDGTTGRTINCGFTGGARFVCIKATSTSGSWWTFDSARGIVTNSDPALQLNSTAAEVTSADAIDTASSGFIVNQEATCSLNASGVSYLVWAIA